MYLLYDSPNTVASEQIHIYIFCLSSISLFLSQPNHSNSLTDQTTPPPATNLSFIMSVAISNKCAPENLPDHILLNEPILCCRCQMCCMLVCVSTRWVADPIQSTLGASWAPNSVKTAAIKHTYICTNIQAHTHTNARGQIIRTASNRTFPLRGVCGISVCAFLRLCVCACIV